MSYWAMETHAIKAPVHSFYADVNNRGSLELCNCWFSRALGTCRYLSTQYPHFAYYSITLKFSKIFRMYFCLQRLADPKLISTCWHCHCADNNMFLKLGEHHVGSFLSPCYGTASALVPCWCLVSLFGTFGFLHEPHTNMAVNIRQMRPQKWFRMLSAPTR